MKFVQIDTGYILRLEIGESVLDAITEFLTRKGIKGGFISGIGAVKDVELGYFDLSEKKYLKNRYQGDFEVISLLGNISLVEGNPFVHAHILIADRDNKTYGGHLVHARVAVTLEVHIQQVSQSIERLPEPRTGLNLLNLHEF